MSEVYKVWIVIECYDEETEEGEEMDAPGASLCEFATYDEAYAAAEVATTGALKALGLPDNGRS